jgi:hypothetical protein
MEAMQLPPAGMEVPQVLAVRTKSPGFAPVGVALPIVMATVPGLVTVIVWAAEVVPRAVEGKVSEVEEVVSEATTGAEVPEELPPHAPIQTVTRSNVKAAIERRRPCDIGGGSFGFQRWLVD